MATAPKRQPRRRPNAARDSAIFDDSYIGGGNLDNTALAEKYGMTPSQISTVIHRQKERFQATPQTEENPAIAKEPATKTEGAARNDASSLHGYPLTQGQRQMLVVEFRAQGKSHKQAIAMAGVSDKGGKNAVRVDREAEPVVAQLVQEGITSVNDAMSVMQLPAEVQNQAAAEVVAGQSKKLATSGAVEKYLDAITPVIRDLNRRQSRKS